MKGWNVSMANCNQIITPCHITENEPIYLELWNSYFSERLWVLSQILFFWEISLLVCIFPIFYVIFLRGSIKRIENRNQWTRSNSASLKTVLCLISIWQKLKKNTYFFLSDCRGSNKMYQGEIIKIS